MDIFYGRGKRISGRSVGNPFYRNKVINRERREEKKDIRKTSGKTKQDVLERIKFQER